MSKYKNWRNSKRAKDSRNVKAMGRRTYGYDYADDGCRYVVDYKKAKKYLKSKVGQKWDVVWSELNKKYDHRTYVGKETLDYYKYLVESRRYYCYDEFAIENDLIVYYPAKKYDYKQAKNKMRLTKLYNKHYVCNAVIWYEVELKEIGLKEQEKQRNPLYYWYGYDLWNNYIRLYDAFFGHLYDSKRVVEDFLIKQYGKVIYVTKKKQVGKSLCKKLNQIWSEK